jgi:hypothetical protein
MANNGIDSTLVIAIYGAVVSTAVFVFDMFKYFNEKPNVIVKTNLSLFYEGGDLKKEKKKIAIEIINTGRRAVTIADCGFKLKTNSMMNIQQVIDPNLPRQLSGGDSYKSYTDLATADSDGIFYAWAKDATGREYRSKKWPIKDSIK